MLSHKAQIRYQPIIFYHRILLTSASELFLENEIGQITDSDNLSQCQIHFSQKILCAHDIKLKKKPAATFMI